MLLVVLNGFVELAEGIEGVSNVAVRLALTRFVACANEKISTDKKCCDPIGRHSPVCCATSKRLCQWS